MLDLQQQALMQQAAEQGAPDFADMEPPEGRAFFREFCTTVGFPPADVAVDDRSFSGPAGDVAVRVYTPKGAGPHPMLLFFHGGGWVIGDLDAYHGLAGTLCEKSGCVVVSVDYRLAPEHRFPAAVDDCYAALEWAAENAAELGADGARIGVAGDSAGGSLATACAMLARDQGGPKVSFQLLFYPVVARADAGYESYRKFAEGHLLSQRAMQYFFGHYFGDNPPASDLRAYPIEADLAGLPPALIVVAGLDPLHDEGVDYADKLSAAGNQVVLTDYPGAEHGFMCMGGALDSAKQAADQAAGALRAALGKAA